VGTCVRGAQPTKRPRGLAVMPLGRRGTGGRAPSEGGAAAGAQNGEVNRGTRKSRLMEEHGTPEGEFAGGTRGARGRRRRMEE
jgi:hypothetical protein